MSPEDYDAWYETPRGRWIGDAEYRLLWRMLRPAPGATVLDAGCGTGYFTRRLAADGLEVTGIDLNPAMIGYAKSHAVAGEHYLVGDAQALPVPDQRFDHAVAITSLCFMPDPERAVRELARVTRRRIALGLLNRASLLFLRARGRAGYRGARWDTTYGARALLARAGLKNITVHSAVFLPGGGIVARTLETRIPGRLPLGGFILAAGDPP